MCKIGRMPFTLPLVTIIALLPADLCRWSFIWLTKRKGNNTSLFIPPVPVCNDTVDRVDYPRPSGQSKITSSSTRYRLLL